MRWFVSMPLAFVRPGTSRSMQAPFASFFMGGFECSTLVRRDGVRLDLLASTGHAASAANDYRRLRDAGLVTVRDGLRWHLIEQDPGRYDWSSLLVLAKAARQAGVQVVWDLCHYGWPDGLDIWSSEFPARLGLLAGEAARVIADATGAAPLLCPVNEMSFWAWAGGEVGRFGPGATGRGFELKRQLVRAYMAATEAARAAVPACRFVCAEPAIHVDPGADPTSATEALAEHHRLSQFEAIDLLVGRLEPELGGHSDYLDLVGINFYPDNQWYLNGRTIPLGHHAFRRFADMATEWHERYGRPVFVAETGAEGSGRAPWLHYVSEEVAEARRRHVPLIGICLYPILDYRGWEDERHCSTGLLSQPGESGERDVYQPLLAELKRQQARLGSEARPYRDAIVSAAA